MLKPAIVDDDSGADSRGAAVTIHRARYPTALLGESSPRPRDSQDDRLRFFGGPDDILCMEPSG
jgi:hypothetical protein